MEDQDFINNKTFPYQVDSVISLRRGRGLDKFPPEVLFHWNDFWIHPEKLRINLEKKINFAYQM